MRKISVAILREALGRHKFQDEEVSEIWGVIFDIYETLESFGSHLNKSVWPRIEVLFSYLRVRKAPLEASCHLEQVDHWLRLLLRRCVSHTNERVARFVVKAILAREYVTPHIHSYLMNEFLS